MTCTKCGKIVLNDGTMCSYCGELVDEQERKKAIAELRDQQQMKKVMFKSAIIMAVFIVIAVLIFILSCNKLIALSGAWVRSEDYDRYAANKSEYVGEMVGFAGDAYAEYRTEENNPEVEIQFGTYELIDDKIIIDELNGGKAYDKDLPKFEFKVSSNELKIGGAKYKRTSIISAQLLLRVFSVLLVLIGAAIAAIRIIIVRRRQLRNKVCE